MKSSRLEKRLKIYTYVVIGLLAVLIIRLAILQLWHNEVYQTQAKQNRIRLLAVKPLRGEIYGSRGEVLATNKLVYTLTISPLEGNKEPVIQKLAAMLADYYPEITADKIEEKINEQRYRLYEPVVIMRDIPWDLVVKIEENRRYLSGVDVDVEPLRTYPHGTLAGHVLGYIHSISREELAEAEEGVYNINSLVGKSGVEKQYEKYLRGKYGARRVEVDARGYPIRELVTLEPVPGNNIYLTLDMNLQKVMEKSMDEVLASLQKSGHPKAKVGAAVAIDVKTGAILAMVSKPDLNPDDFKGNLAPEKAAYYFPQGQVYDPLNPGAVTNRAIQAAYPPGSTFKPITGMAALEAGVIDPLKDYVNCQGRYWVAPYIKCTGVHGNVNYYKALAVSCNTYFQEMGRRAGKDQLIRVASEFGLGQVTGIDLPGEKRGLLPTPEWKREINALLVDRKYEQKRKEMEEKYALLLQEAVSKEERERLLKKKANEKTILEAQYQIDYNFNTKWQPFDTFNMSIGQGSNNYTIIQLANYVAAIANGGKLMQPHVVKKIVNPQGKVVKEFKPTVVRKMNVKPETIAETKRAMLEVTQPGGTAYHLFANFPAEIKVAAKTGTAETGRAGDDRKRDFHGVFIAFAPADDPQIAFAGIVEYGFSGGGSAGYVAKAVFEQYFGIRDYIAEIEATNE
ncbi:peptidoglycan glycosyltransferase [Thermosyntropha lipolytica DSM 11003]|uniref:Peptidoglycan glycosyltransferase n=1 Tax=Thermosyntropha lipolytica DSM 11003 TaxID=1123382 RepID=A0A1M5MP70_9FIRM|nr:penicillin-binding protein 2 [Thermosyntropha lipolytica]SHG78553.1 peptidoglycan glycosyltransferase [Thermosyntropha lipolytica DSM 11003]